MKQTITSEILPIYLWLDDLEQGTAQQARNLANLPSAFHHIAIMPDAHLGYGMPIGGVLATRGVVIPNAVGVDIGCGICAVKTGLPDINTAALKAILGKIRKAIPLGFKHHVSPMTPKSMPELSRSVKQDLPVVEREFERARRQVGTLGGGNHFIELQQGSDNAVWLMIHSGSRNIGYQVAQYYNKVAESSLNDSSSVVPQSWQLASLALNSRAGEQYLMEMQYCVAFAKANRQQMMEVVKEIVGDVCGCNEFDTHIDVAHNYATLETHFDTEVLVHRKGATRAFRGETGIIPGSQGTSSYIVTGLGNQDSFASCSHGAGRLMGRKQARKKLSLQQEQERLNKMKVIHTLRRKSDLDEAPGAYKKISEVMANQTDLVEIRIELRPLAVIKG